MKIRVQKKRCDQCLFTDKKIVSDERKEELLEEIKKDDSYFVCHKASIKKENDVCCRGFYESQLTTPVQLPYRFGKLYGKSFIEEVEIK